LGLINQSGEDQPNGTVVAQVDNYDGGGVTFPAFVYNTEAATVATVGYH
jgi:hypothetical protein